MEENNNTDSGGTEPTKPREDLITTAVKFLQNPKVQKSSLAHRQAFLKQKGLTDEEVQIACERAGAFQRPYNDGQLQTMLQNQAVPGGGKAPYMIQPPTFWMKTRDILNTIALVGGISYGLFLLYKKYIKSFLFGVEKKQKSIEETVLELTKELKKLNANVEKIIEHQKQQPDQSLPMKQIQEMKSELSTLKGLLLNRHQFPAATPSNPIVPPSIPAWQLSSPQATDGEEGQKGEGDIEIYTSGSGSSENEVVINTGSDSSLEMIKE